ncbi:MAG TPA: filamentous hemagglutinin N-terminal domain-containing protein, partial [Desulfatiglandales bacterium]|nr:filamentous hemagglutinin N-terminal domain-containing protein [Desulfatiglandales bacterium]
MINDLFRKRGIAFFLIFMIYSMLIPGSLYALPQGEEVVSGQADISRPDDTSMDINQGTDKAIINWQDFSIAQPETVTFYQPNSMSTALNRVIGVDPSLLYGTLTANGRVYLINTNGILIGPTGKINVNSFIASTLDMADADFLSGNYIFSQTLGDTLNTILNQGSLRAAEGGFVSLLAPAVENQGSIIASLGKVYIGSGEKITLNFMENDLISFAVDKEVLDQVIGLDGQPIENTINNTGNINADGGEVILSARTAYNAIKSVVNNEGVIEARSLNNVNGRIVLNGGSQGIVSNSGVLDASGRSSSSLAGDNYSIPPSEGGTQGGATGGSVDVLGDLVGLFDNSFIDVSGDLGGGTVRIGGDYQGSNPSIQNASRTYVGP